MAETIGKNWDRAYRIDFTGINEGAGFQKKNGWQIL